MLARKDPGIAFGTCYWLLSVLVVCLLAMSLERHDLKPNPHDRLLYQPLVDRTTSSEQHGHGHDHGHDHDSDTHLDTVSSHSHSHNPFDHSHETQHLPPSFVLAGLKPIEGWRLAAEPLAPLNARDTIYRPPTGSPSI